MTAASSWTLPTHASILSGLYPQTHGARWVGEEVPNLNYWNTQEETDERVGHLLAMQGKQSSEVPRLVTGDNPLYEALESRYLGKDRAEFAVSESGVWLRQSTGGQQSIIHANNVLGDGSVATLQSVIVFEVVLTALLI